MDKHLSADKSAVAGKIRRRIERSFDDPHVMGLWGRWCLRNPHKCPAAANSYWKARQHKLLTMLSGISMIESRTAAGNVAAHVCHVLGYRLNQSFRLIRSPYPPDQDSDQMTGLSRNASQTLKERAKRTNYRMFESGLSMRPLSPIGVLDPYHVLKTGKLVQCFDTVFAKHRSKRGSTLQPLPLTAWLSVSKTVIALMTISLSCLPLECATRLFQRTQQTRLRRFIMDVRSKAVREQRGFVRATGPSTHRIS